MGTLNQSVRLDMFSMSICQENILGIPGVDNMLVALAGAKQLVQPRYIFHVGCYVSCLQLVPCTRLSSGITFVKGVNSIFYIWQVRNLGFFAKQITTFRSGICKKFLVVEYLQAVVLHIGRIQ